VPTTQEDEKADIAEEKKEDTTASVDHSKTEESASRKRPREEDAEGDMLFLFLWEDIL